MLVLSSVMFDCDVVVLIDYKWDVGANPPPNKEVWGLEPPSLEMIAGIIYFALWTR